MSQNNPIVNVYSYFEIISKFLGRLSLTEQGGNAVMRLGPQVLKQVLSRYDGMGTQNIRSHAHNNYDFFEIDPTMERLFKMESVKDVIRSAYVEAISKSYTSALKIKDYFKYLHDQKIDKLQMIQWLTRKNLESDIFTVSNNNTMFYIRDNRNKRRED